MDLIQHWQENRGRRSIKILAEKAFEGNCLNRKYSLYITKNKKTKKKHKKKTPFPIRRKFLRASGWGCHELSSRTTNGKCVYVPYWRKIGKPKQDVCFLLAVSPKNLSKMPDVSSASVFLSTLNEIHPSLSFTM